MKEEFDALQRNRTWELSDGTLEHYKARWVVRGFRQHAGIDFTDTFTPTIKPGTIRTF
jgi:histone deacetylase 1/2